MLKYVYVLLIFSTLGCGASKKCFKESMQIGLEGYWTITAENHPYSEVHLRADSTGLTTSGSYFEALVDYDQVLDFSWAIQDDTHLFVEWTSPNDERAQMEVPIVKASCHQVILNDPFSDLIVTLKRK